MVQAQQVFAGVCVIAVLGVGMIAQRSDAFTASREHAAIGYSTARLSNAIETLNEGLARGAVSLRFDPATGYLSSVLDALSVPAESQMLLYSQTSFQAKKISRTNPRALFFNDSLAVGYIRGADLLEVAAQDARQGTIFYALRQSPSEAPRFTREDHCLSCHLSWETRGVPGMFVMTVLPRRSEDEYANGSIIDHRSPLNERWGGWYVTGNRVPESMGNVELLQPTLPPTGAERVPAKRSVEGAFDTRGYLTTFSDVVSLMILEHQAHAMNLMTRAGWEHRIGSPNVGLAVDELVEYLFFVDEAPLPHEIRGSSGFAEKFATLGPRDSKSRSLRELDLNTRLMRYPLSYMIYSSTFAGMPDDVKRMARSRIDDVLAGKDARKKFAHLTPASRAAIREILADTFRSP
jgi:hypothetical protein